MFHYPRYKTGGAEKEEDEGWRKRRKKRRNRRRTKRRERGRRRRKKRRRGEIGLSPLAQYHPARVVLTRSRGILGLVNHS